jgi:hypothetical protein
MPRRKYIIHEYTTDRIKKSFGRIISRNKQANQSRAAFGKVSTIFFYSSMTDTLDVFFFFDVDNLIMMERKKKGKKNK